MFYKIIEKERDEWLNSPDCVISDLIAYIERQHKMRDAQIESIKTYLFLKIQCKNLPLWKIFASGVLNTTDIDTLEVNRTTREVLESNPAHWHCGSTLPSPTKRETPIHPRLLTP